MVVAAALDGATSTPASTSLRTWIERTCGSASVPVTEATIAGPSRGPVGDRARDLAGGIGMSCPSPR